MKVEEVIKALQDLATVCGGDTETDVEHVTLCVSTRPTASWEYGRVKNERTTTYAVLLNMAPAPVARPADSATPNQEGK